MRATATVIPHQEPHISGRSSPRGWCATRACPTGRFRLDLPAQSPIWRVSRNTARSRSLFQHLRAIFVHDWRLRARPRREHRESRDLRRDARRTKSRDVQWSHRVVSGREESERCRSRTNCHGTSGVRRAARSRRVEDELVLHGCGRAAKLTCVGAMACGKSAMPG